MLLRRYLTGCPRQLQQHQFQRQLSSKTMMAKEVEGLYFIGEVVDVTGWLGGFNFQWAWSSGWVAGQVV